ncbi:MAG TPA: hypothetical protein VGD78_10575 [Chthoniobacterales bacterium]
MYKSLFALSFLLAVACAARAQKLDPNATLEKATIRFNTPRDLENADVAAQVSITVGLASGTPVAMSKITVHPGQSDDVSLALQPRKVTRRDFSRAVLFIQFLPRESPGRERWIFNYNVRLMFSDGRWGYDDRVQKVLLDRDHAVEDDAIGLGLKGGR